MPLTSLIYHAQVDSFGAVESMSRDHDYGNTRGVGVGGGGVGGWGRLGWGGVHDYVDESS